MTRDDASLLDIAQAARNASEFASRVEDAEAFKKDRLIQSAVLHQLMIVGEATKRLSARFREAHPDIPWRAMTGTRDYLIHSYDGVILDVVWDTAVMDMPDLLARLEPLLPRL